MCRMQRAVVAALLMLLIAGCGANADADLGSCRVAATAQRLRGSLAENQSTRACMQSKEGPASLSRSFFRASDGLG
jgi:hypothetical protein